MYGWMEGWIDSDSLPLGHDIPLVPVPKRSIARFAHKEFNCSSDRIRKLTLPCAVSNPLLFSPMTFTAALGVEALLSSF